MSFSGWKEKEALMQSDDDLTPLEADRVLLEKTNSGTGSSLVKAAVVIATGLLVGLIVVQVSSHILLAAPSSRNGDADDDVFKMTMQFRGADDVDVEQHVTSATTDNYVIYHVIKPHETTWIVDDFERSLQLMKIVSEEESVCYVTYLNRTLSTRPEAYGSQLLKPTGDAAAAVERKRFQTTFYVDEMQVDDVAQLGTRALNLCGDTPTFWVHPFTASSSPSTAVNSDTHHRDKRNVKKCMTSCCLMVCCCNQRFLQWQTDQKFNCHNVCRGCTPQAKMSIHQVC